jgi:hypothetical protein
MAWRCQKFPCSGDCVLAAEQAMRGLQCSTAGQQCIVGMDVAQQAAMDCGLAVVTLTTAADAAETIPHLHSNTCKENASLPG